MQAGPSDLRQNLENGPSKASRALGIIMVT